MELNQYLIYLTATEEDIVGTLTHLLKRVDQGIFRGEQWLITLAMTVMTVTKCLDITYRALKGQQSKPFIYLINLFGVFEFPSDLHKASSSITGVMIIIIAPWIVGWAVYASRHRGEKNIVTRAMLHGLWWILGALIGAITLYHAPSRFLCAGLSGLSGALIIYFNRESIRDPLSILGILCYLTCAIYLSLQLPQDYIWSTELSLILLAWVAFLGASMATHQHKHIQIKAFFGLYPDRFKPYVVAYGLILTALFAAYLTISLGVSVFGDRGSFYSGGRRPSTQIPDWIILFSGVVSFALVSLRSLFYAILIFINPSEAPQNEESHT